MAILNHVEFPLSRVSHKQSLLTLVLTVLIGIEPSMMMFLNLPLSVLTAHLQWLPSGLRVKKKGFNFYGKGVTLFHSPFVLLSILMRVKYVQNVGE